MAAILAVLLGIAGAAPATEIPAAGYFNGAITNQNAKDAQDQVLAVLREMVGGQASSTLTIAGGAVTPTRALQAIDTEAAASTDNLDNILTANMPDGRIIAIRCADNSRAVVVRSGQGGAGQILLSSGSSLTLNDTTMWLLLERRGSDWREFDRIYGANLTAFRSFYGLMTLAGGNLTGALNEAKATAVASASSTDIWNVAGNYLHITGTTTINNFGASGLPTGAERTVIFDGALQLTHGASLNLGGANIVTAAGDRAKFRADTSSSTVLVSYHRANGEALVGAAGGFSTMVVFTANDTWTVPAGVTTAYVQAWGGGGAGGQGQTGGVGGGGGAGGYAAKVLTGLTPSTGKTVTIGAGGTAPAGNGGSTSLDSDVIAPGGSGGANASGAGTSGAGGAGGVPSVCDLCIAGEAGGNGGAGSPGAWAGGYGGNAPLGVGAGARLLASTAAGIFNTSGTSGYGAGGGGGRNAGSGTSAGSAGRPGLMIIWY